MTEILTINNVRGYLAEDGKAYLNAEDVARGFGFTQRQIKNGKEYISIRWETVNRYLTEFGFPQNVGESDFLPENMVYRLGFKASNEIAQKFQTVLADEVLPSIRKHGAYMTPDVIEKTLTNPDFIIRLATELKQEQAKLAAEKARNAQLETKVWQDAPKVALADAIVASETSVSMATLAKLITQNGHEIGQRRLFDWMRVNGWLIRSGADKNKPTQKAMRKGLFEVHEHVLFSRYGTSRIIRTTKVTGRGQQFFINKFMHPEEKGYTV